MQLGCCVRAEYLPHVLTSGFDFAELPCNVTQPTASTANWRVTRDRLLSYEVPIHSFNVLLPPDMKIVGEDVNKERTRAYLSIVIDRIAELGGKHIAFGSGGARTVPDGCDMSRAREQLIEFIYILTDMTRPYSLQVNLEFLNQKETNLMVSLLEANEYAQIVDQPNIRILTDLYHMMEEQEPIAHLLQVRDSIGYVHIADTRRRYPGSGTYPFTEFFDALKAIGYGGPVSIECNWHDTVVEMTSSAQFLTQLMKGSKTA